MSGAAAADILPPLSSQPIFKQRRNKPNNARKRATTPPAKNADTLDSDISSGYSSVDEAHESGRESKRRKKHSLISATSKSQQPRDNTLILGPSLVQADRSATITSTNDATKQSNWYDDSQPDVKSLLGTSKNHSTESTRSTQTPTSTSMPPKKQVGPLKAPTNVRTITVIDFAPDVCKDYKQTGFCGFGDSCKFLHAREDYKQGWELDRDWDVTKKHAHPTNTNQSTDGVDDADMQDEALLESIPFACVICREAYKTPIITKCAHYFCEACALKRYRRSPSCAVCGAGTGGVFNTAKQLNRLLERKKAREEARGEDAVEAA